MIEYLEWDSQFFKRKIGKVNGISDIQTLLTIKKEERYERIYVYSKERIENPHPQLLLVDEKVTFKMPVSNNKFSPNYTKQYTGGITQELIDLALLSGHKSRFKTDAFFESNFKELYLQWLKNSLNKTFASEVMVAYLNGGIQGFVTVNKKEDQGNIGLIAVNKKTHGKGIGKDLLLAANQWYIQNKISTCSVITQLSNKQACSFYSSFGYKVKQVDYIYHL